MLAEADHTGGPAARAYMHARVYYEAQHWSEAAIEFRALAISYPDEELAIFASQLYLESSNLLGAHARRPECYDDIAGDVPLFTSIDCRARRSKQEDQCVLFEKIQLDMDRLKAQRQIEAADATEKRISRSRARTACPRRRPTITATMSSTTQEPRSTPPTTTHPPTARSRSSKIPRTE